MNLSNIVSRRSHHREALDFCASARRRFKNVKESKWQAMAENGLANTYAELNDFDQAEQFYAIALEGEAYLADGNVTRAKETFEAVLTDAKRLQQPDSKQRVLFLLGRTALKMGDPTRAISSCEWQSI